MTYENTIRNALMTYGTIFPSEWHVCDHMFCVIGNGWNWKNGQVVSDDYKKKKQVLTIKDMLNDETPRCDEYYRIYNFNKDFKKHISEAKHLALSLRDDLIHNQSAIMNYEFGNYFVPNFDLSIELPKVYDTCEYSLINNIPKNIKPDWVAGLYKFCKFCLKNSFLIESDKTKSEIENAMKYLEENHKKHIPWK